MSHCVKSGSQESTQIRYVDTWFHLQPCLTFLFLGCPELWSIRERDGSREIYSLVSGNLLLKLTSDLFVSTLIPDVPSA
ncbi:hypothetical protein V8C34DRAFT_109780 [Trichoderma compactum]